MVVRQCDGRRSDLQLDLLGVRRIESLEFMDKGVTKVEEERIDEGVLRWLGYVERMENNSIAKGVYVGEFAGSRLVSSQGRDNAKDCLRKRGLDVRQKSRMVQDRRKWWGFVRGLHGAETGV